MRLAILSSSLLSLQPIAGSDASVTATIQAIAIIAQILFKFLDLA